MENILTAYSLQEKYRMAGYRMILLNFLFTILSMLSKFCKSDPASEQLLNYSLTHNTISKIRTDYGVLVDDISNSLTVGPRGPLLLQDNIFIELTARFNRQRIPERVVHSRGSGAFGYFEITNDITKYSKAKVFSHVGKKTSIAVRFSLANLGQDLPEPIRTERGFAIKFYTDDGIWDIVGYGSEVFFIRDAIRFPMLSQMFGRNPVTNIRDLNMIWDFMTGNHETVHTLLRLFSSEGIPDGYRHMHGFGQHAFKLVNQMGEAVYAKFHFLTDLGVRSLTPERAENLIVTDPDYFTRDLYNAIAEGNYPSWTFYIQVMTFDEAEKFQWNPFDVTKIWPKEDFPLIEVGKFYLNKNPKNYFADVEQIAFSPSHMVPGIEPSLDKMLQGRLFVYSDSQRYRLGTNHMQLPVNNPFRGHKVPNYNKDGPFNILNQGGAPIYFPNSFNGPQPDPRGALSKFSVSGDVARYNSSDEDNYSQATMYWNEIGKEEQSHIVDNLLEVLRKILPFLQKRAVEMFSRVNHTLGIQLERGLKLDSSSESIHSN